MGKSVESVECTAMLLNRVYVAKTVDRSLTTLSMEGLLDAQRRLADSLDRYEASPKRPFMERLQLKAWIAFASIASAVTPSRLGIEYAHWRQPASKAAA